MTAPKIAPPYKHIVITGASSGIGAALARHYAPGRPILSILGRNETRLHSVRQQCEAAGATGRAMAGDVTDTRFMTAWLNDCDAFAPVDCVIANAGLGGTYSIVREGAAEDVTVASDIFRTNIIGVTNTILPLLPRLAARKRGQLLLMSSLAGYLALPEAPAYSASKAAIRIYADGLRRRVSRFGVHVSVACPGFVRTPMSNRLPGKLPFLWESDRAAQYIANEVARGRDEIAFPWPLYAATRAAAILPSNLLDALLRMAQRRLGVW